jgi:hypothetical protein
MYFNAVNNCGGTATINWSRTKSNGEVETGVFSINAFKSMNNYMMFKGQYSFDISLEPVVSRVSQMKTLSV